MDTHLQLIIGTDKKNPSFTIYRNTKEKTIDVYYGLALLEIITDKPDNPELKHLTARLFAAGINRKKLTKAFGYSYTAMHRWSAAIKSGDGERILNALSGQGARKKITNEIRLFIIHRFKSIYKNNKYTYSKEILEEIKDVFQITISAESLRPLFKELKEKYFSSPKKKQVNPEKFSFKFTYQLSLPPAKKILSLPEPKKTSVETVPYFLTDEENPNFSSINSCDLSLKQSDIEIKEKENPKLSSIENSTKKGFCYHVGVLIFMPFLNKIKNIALGTCEPYVIQWLVSILLGVKNIEQSKLLNSKSLNIFFEQFTRNLNVQRKNLKEFSTEDNMNKLLNFNTQLANVENKTDFYYDPHTKHYTGVRKILKSWCSKIRMADKIINTDFIHTADGFPVYLNNGDTFDDMRVRFFKDVKRFRNIARIPDNKTITMCVDRGIFSEDVFKDCIKLKNLILITWEKGYKQDMWNDKSDIKTGNLIRVKNNKKDVKLITYKYQEYTWHKNKNVRQLIVRVPEKKGKNFIEVSILINDFKYLIAHFGLDQITSYQFFDYKDIKDTVSDKQHVSAEYKALTKELEKIRRKLKTALHKKHEFDSKLGIYEDISAITNQLTNQDTKELIAELANKFTKIEPKKNAKKPTKKQKESYKKILIQIVDLSKEYYQKKTERTNIDKNVPKIEELSETGKQKLNTKPKQFMDIIKIIAHNIFLLSFQKFKEKYDNYRDDHLIFRAFSHSDGIIEINNTEMIIYVKSKMQLYPKQEKIFSEIFNEINNQNINLFKNPNLKIRLVLNDKFNSFFAIEN